MSTVVASFFQDRVSSKKSPGASIARGVAQAWFNINEVGTNVTRDSLNVSSATDLATGQLQINFTSSFASANYIYNSVGDGSGAYIDWARFDITAPTAGVAKVGFGSSTFANADATYAMGAFIGELA